MTEADRQDFKAEVLALAGNLQQAVSGGADDESIEEAVGLITEAYQSLKV